MSTNTPSTRRRPHRIDLARAVRAAGVANHGLQSRSTTDFLKTSLIRSRRRRAADVRGNLNDV